MIGRACVVNFCSIGGWCSYSHTDLDFFTVPLHSPNGRQLLLGHCKGTVAGVWKTVGIPTGHMCPYCNRALGNPNLYLDQPITKSRCQPIGGHVSYPTDSPIVSRLGLFSSLTLPYGGCQQWCSNAPSLVFARNSQEIWLLAPCLRIYPLCCTLLIIT